MLSTVRVHFRGYVHLVYYVHDVCIPYSVSTLYGYLTRLPVNSSHDQLVTCDELTF